MSVRVVDEEVVRLARELVEFAEGRSDKPPSIPKEKLKEVLYALRQLGYDPNDIKAKVEARTRRAASPAQQQAQPAPAAHAAAGAVAVPKWKTVKLSFEELGEAVSSNPRITQLEMLLPRMLLLGPPGIGKTERIMQLAREEAMENARSMGMEYVEITEKTPREEAARLLEDNTKYKFVDLRALPQELVEKIARDPEAEKHVFVYYRLIAPHVFPEDVSVPKVFEEFTRSVPLNVFKALERAPGVLFIDELTNLEDAKQISMYYSILQELELGLNVRLHPRTKIVAAGNKTEHSQIAKQPPEPLRNRLTILELEPPTIREWAEYMDKHHSVRMPDGSMVREWDDVVLAFLALKAVGNLDSNEPFKPPDSIREWENFPSPRAYTELALLLKKIREKLAEIEEELQSAKDAEERKRLEERRKNLLRMVYHVAKGRLGSVVGADFYAFYVIATSENVAKLIANAEEDPSVLDNMLREVNEKLGKADVSKTIGILFLVLKHAAEGLLTLKRKYEMEKRLSKEEAERVLKLWRLVSHMTSSAPLMLDMFQALLKDVMLKKDLSFIVDEAKRFLGVDEVKRILGKQQEA
jgi:MoxR-like ATPase